ncbi:MAG TPA: DUF192 domain-containing protein [Vicinamibacterales bacterium]
MHASGACGLRVEQSGAWLAVHLEIAGTSSSRRRGLAGRDCLPAGHGLVIAPSQGVHTFGMRFPIDVVGVSRRGRVVSLRRRLMPRRVVFSWRAFAIVELPEGAVEAAGVGLADQLIVVRDPILSG